MHISHMLGASVLLATVGWFVAADSHDSTAAPPLPPPPPPLANGHDVLVVDGDRDQLTIARASHKVDPWAGVPKGLQSAWTLVIHAADGSVLAEVPLDLAHFDTGVDRKNGGVRVAGDIVRDARITMLVNAPHFATAATYRFTRGGANGAVVVGEVTAARVRELTGGGR